ncbi:DUF938 domain-containing protein [Alteromonas pelagimontana]|nr:DUF938 domain-containing protein [Alteromonas pelagimontana]
MNKPFSQACENNKGPILELLKAAFADSTRVLEIGSGTGQHAVYFAPRLPHLVWQTSDQVQYHEGICQWINEEPAANLRMPVTLKIGEQPLSAFEFDAVYSANTAHIMQPEEAKSMMQQISACLPAGGVFCQYGPFLHNGKFSSQSNEEFHHHLLSQGFGGYRDISELERWAPALQLKTMAPMPANNLLLIWQKAP